MKKYLLLRDNRQSGPFTLAELRELKLAPKDLVWLEGESTCWLYPSELDELKDFISEEKKVRRNVFVSLPGSARSERRYPVAESRPRPTYQPMEKEDSFISEPPGKVIWSSKRLALKNIFSVAALFCGLVAGAFLMKKAVDGSDKPLAVESVPLTVIADQPPQSAPVQNAVEIVTAKQIPEKTTPPPKPVAIKKQLAIKANDYSVGMLGGINNLQLKVFNRSSHSIDRVDVAIQYLKPNGNVIETGMYTLYSLRPFSSKTLSVPDNKRGVKVKYKIVDVKSKDYSNAIKQV